MKSAMQRANRLHFAALHILVGAVLLALGIFFWGRAGAAVTPPSFDATLTPGESATVNKTVDIPDVPRRLDFVLIVDLTGSYSDDLPTMKSLAPDIFDRVRSMASTSQFGLTTFVDFPFGPWGAPGEYAYRRDQPLTDDRATWVAAVNRMSNLGGGDFPESQYEALYQTVTGAGREMPITTDGDYTDPGEIAPGQQIRFRIPSTRVIAITTDADFHLPGDFGSSFPYPGPSRNTTVDALKAANVKVVAIKAPGSGSQMDDLASATGGTVVTTGSTSAEIATAITNALGALTFTITPFVQGCDPLQLSFNPPSINDVPGGTSVKFDETIKVPADVDLSTLPPDRTIRCTVRFRASGSTVGSQTIAIKVNSRPDCSAVQAQPNILVPPNHQLREVKLSGATDPDGDPLVLTVTGVTQDEPLNGASDGDRYPDAQAGSTSDTVLLRAERSSSGDGRVYKVRFGVSDGLGGSCTGSVAVSAPLNKGGALFAVDSGQTVNSFGP